MRPILREASRHDLAALHRVRVSVRENPLTSTVISEADYMAAIEQSGRGWVIDLDGIVVGFAVGNRQTGNIWALFVDPDHERRGYGRQLHDAMVSWLWSQGLERLWLTTAAESRAARFYRAAGWLDVGSTADGETRFELHRGRACRGG
jgi:GNAT superfamily N-acetyltransferase